MARLSYTPGGPQQGSAHPASRFQSQSLRHSRGRPGVFNRDQRLPVGVHFGPYEGELTDEDEAIDSGYSWMTPTADPSHILHPEFELLPSGRRFRLPQCKLNRLKNSFVPHSVSLLNKHGGRWVDSGGWMHGRRFGMARLSYTPGGPQQGSAHPASRFQSQSLRHSRGRPGVFNRDQRLPVGVHFGPYEGELTDEDEAIDSGYSWMTVRSVTTSSLMNVRCMAPLLYLRLSYTPGAPAGLGSPCLSFSESESPAFPGRPGVFNRDQRLPVGVHFGPYEGELTDEDEAIDSGYSWMTPTADPSHILHPEFELLPSGRRFRLPQCKLNRLKNSFVPHSVSLLNKHGGRWVDSGGWMHGRRFGMARLSYTPGGPQQGSAHPASRFQSQSLRHSRGRPGVFNRDQRLPVGVHFGPYEGELTDEDEAIDSGYSWMTPTADPSHILHPEFELLPSGRRFRLPQCKLNRLKNSFVPHSVSLLNKHGGRWVDSGGWMHGRRFGMARLSYTPGGPQQGSAHPASRFQSQSLRHSRGRPGVFNRDQRLPVGVHFGPYEGELTDEDEAIDSGYSWMDGSADPTADPSHILHPEFELLPSGRRFRLPQCKLNRLKNSLSYTPGGPQQGSAHPASRFQSQSLRHSRGRPGVFNRDQRLPVGVHFGPYEGELTDEDEAIDSGYSWMSSSCYHRKAVQTPTVQAEQAEELVRPHSVSLLNKHGEDGWTQGLDAWASFGMARLSYTPWGPQQGLAHPASRFQSQSLRHSRGRPGVFNRDQRLPVGVHFGPYEGELTDEDEAIDSGYSWM
ncbi:hypothetical protein AAFF_G00275870, partial [Aldrovandia affinis]